MFGGVVRTVVATIFAAMMFQPPAARIGVAAASHRAESVDDVRALWVVRTSLTSSDAVSAMVSSAKAAGFNTLLIQIRGRGDAYYAHSLEPRPPALASRGSFDPLQATISLGHEAGLRVHAWINVNLVAGLDLPAARDHIIYRHPEWVMVPRTMVDEVSRLNPSSPEYLARLSRHEKRTRDAEGLYLSPASPESVDYTVGVIRDIASRYAVDGVHLDYIRYPDEDSDYGRDTLDRFRRTVSGTLSSSERKRYDSGLSNDPLVYTRSFADRWRAFRTDRLTDLVARVRRTVREVRPAAMLSAAVTPDPGDAVTRRFQDWRGWIAANLVDVACPMAYTTDADVFASQVATAKQVAGSRPVWAGIGAYRLSPSQIVANVRTARRLGAEGVVLFSYDSLVDPTRGRDYLGRIGRAAFTP
ncbi:MAG TPA: family 10 glycosylhydrolase [Vicinamibacterales bacterium]|jgi:uncharacterized lipoprotein YddW (UPF0748 family)